MEPELTPNDFRVRTVAIEENLPEGLQIDEADVVVVGGYGLKSSGGLESLLELVRLLNGALGGTRPAHDEGWIPESGLVGVSGKIVSPKVLFSFGASGANHYTAGFTKAGLVVAVNNDPQAKIFEVCDLGLVGDVKDIVPALIEQLQR